MTLPRGTPAILAGLAAAPILFTVAASATLMQVKGWWSLPYFTDGLRWSWAWWLYVSDWQFMPMVQKANFAAAGILGVAMALLPFRFIGKVKKKLYGEAKWQTVAGAKEAGLTFSFQPPPDGILLGKLGFRYVSLRGDNHVSLTATTGAGKGVSFVVPNVLNWGGPVFCFSVKRDILDTCAAERERKGDRVFVFDVTEPDGLTHAWSGFGEARRGTPDAYDDVQRVMWALIPESKANNPYWDNAARKVATAVGVMLSETPGAVLNVADILQIIEAQDYELRLRNMIYQSRLEGRPFPAAAVNVVLSWLDSKAEEGAAAVRENILTALALWHIPRIAAATGADDFRLGNIRSQRVSVFVCAQPGDIRRLRPIYSLLFSQLILMNSRVEFGKDPTHRDIRTLVMLDERWALGEVKELDDAFAFIRSYGLRCCLVLQTKDQMRSALGQEGARNLFNNANVELIFGGTDQETAKEVAERSGKDTVEESSTSKPRFFSLNFGRHSQNVQAKGRDLILPQEVAGLSPDTVVVLMKGKPPLKLKRIFWYKDSAFKFMDGEPPPMQSLQVNVHRDEGTDLGE